MMIRVHKQYEITLQRMISARGFPTRQYIGQNIVDFYDPRLPRRLAEMMDMFWSSASYDPDRKSLDVVVRTYLGNSPKRLTYSYCCENGDFMCRPHVQPSYEGFSVLAVEAHFSGDNALERFGKLLDELKG